MKNLSVTDVGRAVARSGLLPKTAAQCLDYFRTNINALAELMDGATAMKDDEVRSALS